MADFRAGTGEKMQYMVHDFNDNTIRFVLRYAGHLQADTLRCAVRRVIDGYDVLHASFVPERIGAHWHVHENYADDSCFVHVTTADDPVDAAWEQALRPIAAAAETQLRCALVQGAEDCCVAVIISHLCVDGSDGKYLLEKLMEAYNLQLQGGGELKLKQGSRAAEQVYALLSKKEIRQLLADPRTGVKSVFPFADAEPGVPNAAWQLIPADVMALAHSRAKTNGATVNDLLLAACYQAYGELSGVDAAAPMSIMSMMDLRRHCPGQDSEGLSNLSGSLPTCLQAGVHVRFEDTLRDIAAQTALAKADPLAGLKGMPLIHGAVRTLPMHLLLTVAGRIYGSMAVGLTNIGNMAGDALSMGGKRPCAGWFGGPAKKKPGMQVSVMSLDGACALSVAGEYTAQDKQLIEKMLACMAHYICEYAQEK